MMALAERADSNGSGRPRPDSFRLLPHGRKIDAARSWHSPLRSQRPTGPTERGSPRQQPLFAPLGPAEPRCPRGHTLIPQGRGLLSLDEPGEARYDPRRRLALAPLGPRRMAPRDPRAPSPCPWRSPRESAKSRVTSSRVTSPVSQTGRCDRGPLRGAHPGSAGDGRRRSSS